MSITLIKTATKFTFAHWPVKERRTNCVSYHFINIWLGGRNISFDIQTKFFILFCYFFVIFITEKNDRFIEKIHKVEMYWHHFIWLLYLVICHFGKKCSTLLKFLKWPHTAAMWRSVNPSLFLNFSFAVQYRGSPRNAHIGTWESRVTWNSRKWVQIPVSGVKSHLRGVPHLHIICMY